jgi:polyphosphate glucokinase
MSEIALGIDIGGTGIKGALVDLISGKIVSQRVCIDTPAVSTPTAVIDIIAQIIDEVEAPADATVGIAFPAPVKKGGFDYIANLDQSWLGVDLGALAGSVLGRGVTVLNDADAAGYGEAKFGAGAGTSVASNVIPAPVNSELARPGIQADFSSDTVIPVKTGIHNDADFSDGLVFFSTLGTGIGTALIHNGVLIPNLELGHLLTDFVTPLEEYSAALTHEAFDAEYKASAVARERDGIDWVEYAQRLHSYYAYIEHLFSPDLIIIGGGASNAADKFFHLIDIKTPIVAATLLNDAGIIGAAYCSSL